MAEVVKIMGAPKKADAPVPGPVPVKAERTADLATRMKEVFDSISRRAFDLFENNGRMLGREWDDWFKAESEILHPVFLNVEESDKSVTVKAEVPGFTAQDLQVSVEGSRLTITGKRETKEEKTEKKTVYREQYSDQIMRVIDLPTAVDVERTSATLRDGRLELVMPKAAPARKIAIEPKAG
jgi:HSP20 family protein